MVLITIAFTITKNYEKKIKKSNENKKQLLEELNTAKSLKEAKKTQLIKQINAIETYKNLMEIPLTDRLIKIKKETIDVLDTTKIVNITQGTKKISKTFLQKKPGLAEINCIELTQKYNGSFEELFKFILIQETKLPQLQLKSLLIKPIEENGSQLEIGETLSMNTIYIVPDQKLTLKKEKEILK